MTNHRNVVRKGEGRRIYDQVGEVRGGSGNTKASAAYKKKNYKFYSVLRLSVINCVCVWMSVQHFQRAKCVVSYFLERGNALGS